MSVQWQHGLFGCFDNIGLCVITYFVPCYTFGKVAEGVGESCLTCGLALLVPILGIVAAVKVRGKVREQKRIEGTTVNDLLMVCCCSICSLVQEAQEVGVPIGQSMARQ